MNAFKHRIDRMYYEVRTVHSAMFQARPTAGLSITVEIIPIIPEKVIRTVTTVSAALIVFTVKKNRSLKICVNYQKLNAVTIRDWYTLLCMDECIDSLEEAIAFLTLDRSTEYCQTKINEHNRGRTAFVFHDDLY